MNSWAKIPLKRLGKIVSGSTPSTNVKEYWDGDIPWITPADLTGHTGIYFQGKLRRITQAGYKSCSTKMLPSGSILFSSRAPIGHCAVTVYPLCTNQGFKSIIPNERLNSVYGYFALKYFTPMLVSAGRGATFAEINKELFGDFEIPLPPVYEQKRIATILEKVDRLRRLRRFALELGDGYLQSVFLEMFGDPITNPMEWEHIALKKYIHVQGGFSFKSGDFTNSGVRVVKIRNVHKNYLTWGEVEYLPVDFLKRYSEYELNCDDIVMSLTRPIIKSLDSIKVCRVRQGDLPSLLNQRVGRLIIRDHNVLLKEYLLQFCYLPYFKQEVDNYLSESLQPNISINQVGEIPIIVPPISKQEKFAKVVQGFERLRTQQQESLRQAEYLLQSLLNKIFDY